LLLDAVDVIVHFAIWLDPKYHILTRLKINFRFGAHPVEIRLVPRGLALCVSIRHLPICYTISSGSAVEAKVEVIVVITAEADANREVCELHLSGRVNVGALRANVVPTTDISIRL
jgi:hypothetical protein